MDLPIKLLAKLFLGSSSECLSSNQKENEANQETQMRRQKCFLKLNAGSLEKSGTTAIPRTTFPRK
jgi:hypothetical protein